MREKLTISIKVPLALMGGQVIAGPFGNVFIKATPMSTGVHLYACTDTEDGEDSSRFIDVIEFALARHGCGDFATVAKVLTHHYSVMLHDLRHPHVWCAEWDLVDTCSFIAMKEGLPWRYTSMRRLSS